CSIVQSKPVDVRVLSRTMFPLLARSRPNRWYDVTPAITTSAAAYSRFAAVSMTGVPRMPDRPTLPHAQPPVCGVPTCFDHITTPVPWFSAYTVPLSVAAYTTPLKMSGSAYTSPSSVGETQPPVTVLT